MFLICNLLCTQPVRFFIPPSVSTFPPTTFLVWKRPNNPHMRFVFECWRKTNKLRLFVGFCPQCVVRKWTAHWAVRPLKGHFFAILNGSLLPSPSLRYVPSDPLPPSFVTRVARRQVMKRFGGFGSVLFVVHCPPSRLVLAPWSRLSDL